MLLQIDFIGDADAWNVGALVAHLGVPVSQIGVGHFARHIEHHDADVRSEIIRRVQLVKRLLTRCVPNVNFESLVAHLVVVSEHGQCVRRRGSLLVVIEKESFDKLGLADGRVTTKDEFEVTSLHLLRLSNSLVEDLLVVVRS